MESLADFIARQLERWPLASRNFEALSACRRREVQVPVGDGYAPVTILFNPERVRSTAAKVDAASVAARPCFLCFDNRPKEQLVHPGLQEFGYDILVNPFPILSPHYTIVSRRHEPQIMPLQAMLTAAERFPHLVFFFNGAQSGASAPDHLHFQAVAKSDLPIIIRAEEAHRVESHESCTVGENFAATAHIRTNEELGILHPASFMSIICSGNVGTHGACNRIAGPHSFNPQLINSFVFKRNDGQLQVLHFPRIRHRASSYPEPMVSPGALDVAGLLVTVRRQDFDSLTPETIAQIYSETCPHTLN